MTTWLDRDIGPKGPYMALCLSEEAFLEALKHVGGRTSDDWAPKSGARTHHLESSNSSTSCCIVCMSDWQGKDPVSVAAMLVHEAVHVWQEHCRNIGETRPGDEQEAYAIQWISQTLMEDFARQLREING